MSSESNSPSKTTDPLINKQGEKPITNKHWKKQPCLEKINAVADYLSKDCLEFIGGKFIPMQWGINF